MFGSFEGSPSVSFIFCLIKVFPYMEPQPDFMALKWHNRLFLAWLLVSADQLAEEERVIPNFKYKQECGQTRSAEGSFFWPSCRGSSKMMKQKGESLIHLCLLSPPDTPAVTGQCSVTRQGQRRRCWDEWKCGECGRNTHTHSISLCNVISGEAASCCFDLILTLSRWPGTVCSLSQIFVDSVLNSNPKWI